MGLQPLNLLLNTQMKLLKTCVKSGTQNTNESFHDIIWAQCPKVRSLLLLLFAYTTVYNKKTRDLCTFGKEPII